MWGLPIAAETIEDGLRTQYFERLIPEDFHSPPGIQDASSQIENGVARPWNEPGLGIHVDWEWVKKHQVAELG